jgi:pterin-4a-carbinolamine dehydratase
MELRDEQWDQDVRHLCNVMTKDYGFSETDSKVIMPTPQVRIVPLTQEELDRALLDLPRWEPVETTIIRDYPNSRHELRRAFRFASFKGAIAFISNLVGPVNALKHHPRIENQWRTVIVYFSTWDIGNKITELDIVAAREVDRVYQMTTTS